jgi:lysophospholipase L1-like esterase
MRVFFVSGATQVRRRALILILPAILFIPPAVRSADLPPFAWRDGDRVVLIGDTLIERDQEYGYLEALVTDRNLGKTITWRNLGWSGDTVGGIARAGFGKPEDGYNQLVAHVRALEPTVLIVGYGMTDSFAGAAGVPAFRQGLSRLLDDLAGTKARLVLLAPLAHEDRGRPLPDPTRHNQDLALYREPIRAAAQERKAWFVDLAERMAARRTPNDLVFTDDGIHLNARGYMRLAWALADDLDAAGSVPAPYARWYRHYESLRQAIVAKNRLYFYRWRPQNETYLFGFRKHEQGNNAREIPLFDPLVAAKEAEIARLKEAR